MPVAPGTDGRMPPDAGDYRDRIICRSSEAMVELPDGAVALTVTSPPYWNAVDYDRHARDPEGCYRTRTYAEGYTGYREYLEWLARIGRELLRVTRPGGFLAVVVGTVLHRGRHYPVPFDLTVRLQEVGFQFHQDIIWHKVTGGVKRARVFLQKPYPGYFYPNIMTEYILIFSRPGERIYRERSQEQLRSAEVETQRLFTNEVANNVWHIAPVPPRHLDHPCPFPEEIPYRLISLYCYPGELVLDPFCGSGQTPKVARHLGRHYIGYDTVGEYVEYARKRLDEPLALRPRQLVAAFERIEASAERRGPSRPRKE